MHRLRICVLGLIVLSSYWNLANADTRHSVGIGIQYAGLIGYQFNTPIKQGNLRMSLGVVGISAGYDHIFSEKVTLGIQGFFVVFGEGGGVNLNYHFSNVRSSGWILGWDIYAATSELSNEYRQKYKLFTLLSFGYKF